VIISPAAPLGAARAAGCAGQGRLPVWLVSPGDDDLGIAFQAVACDPVRVVRDDPAALEAAWREERATWGAAGPGVPIAAGFFAYELGRRFESVRGAPPATRWAALDFNL
jgi:hypothetical protein